MLPKYQFPTRPDLNDSNLTITDFKWDDGRNYCYEDGTPLECHITTYIYKDGKELYDVSIVHQHNREIATEWKGVTEEQKETILRAGKYKIERQKK